MIVHMPDPNSMQFTSKISIKMDVETATPLLCFSPSWVFPPQEFPMSCLMETSSLADISRDQKSTVVGVCEPLCLHLTLQQVILYSLSSMVLAKMCVMGTTYSYQFLVNII